MRLYAFTLIELLVTVSMLAILAALLLPALASGKSKVRQTECTGNLRQWGLSFQMYADDHQDFLPRRGQGAQVLATIDRPEDWFNALPPYLGLIPFKAMVTNNTKPAAHSKSLFICPVADDSGATYFLPYGMNMNLSPWNLTVQTKLDQVLEPECVVSMADAPGPYASTFPSTHPYSAVARHAAKINLLFLAGSVQSFAGDYVGCGVGDPHRPDVHWLTGTASDSTAANY